MDKKDLRIPRSVAIIMDGNGRWAKMRNLSRVEGHRAGSEAVRPTVETCRRLGVEILTLYAFSTENWSRPKTEVSALMHLLPRFLKSETQTMLSNDIRLGSIGNRENLPKRAQQALADCERKTAHCRSMLLNLALSYGGRDEIVRACRGLGKEIAEGRLRPEEITEEKFVEYLDTPAMPDLDLLIRTSGEMRISNFLLWQIAYAEVYVTPVLWPDFREQHLIEAFEWYSRRERRFGKIEPDAAI
jgi:undecaprenyl diphosphate synthase